MSTIRRAFDILFALTILIVTAPLSLLAIAGIMISSPGPVLYRAHRAGIGGEPYPMYKFRTMHHAKPGSGSQITAPGDARVFPFARFLRASKVDELPQFINVLRGEMAIVGPRPESAAIVDQHYSDWMRETLLVPPGITSPGSLFGYTHADRLLDPNDPEGSYLANVLAPKLAIERAYIERAGFLSDLGLIMRTVLVIAAIVMGKRSFALPNEAREAGQWYSFDQSPLANDLPSS